MKHLGKSASAIIPAVQVETEATSLDRLKAAVDATVSIMASVYGGQRTIEGVTGICSAWLTVIEDIEGVKPSSIKTAKDEILKAYEGFFPPPSMFRREVMRAVDHERFLDRHREINEQFALEQRNDHRTVDEIRAAVKAKLQVEEGGEV